MDVEQPKKKGFSWMTTDKADDFEMKGGGDYYGLTLVLQRSSVIGGF